MLVLYVTDERYVQFCGIHEKDEGVDLCQAACTHEIVLFDVVTGSIESWEIGT